MSDTKQQLANKIADALLTIADKILVLRVTTVVGNVTAANVGSPDATTVTVDGNDQIVGYHAVDMALGNTDNAYSKAFVGDKTLTDLHAQAIADALRVRAETFELLKKMAEMIGG